jgi:hypothetical protein
MLNTSVRQVKLTLELQRIDEKRAPIYMCCNLLTDQRRLYPMLENSTEFTLSRQT